MISRTAVSHPKAHSTSQPPFLIKHPTQQPKTVSGRRLGIAPQLLLQALSQLTEEMAKAHSGGPKIGVSNEGFRALYDPLNAKERALMPSGRPFLIGPWDILHFPVVGLRGSHSGILFPGF